MVNTRKIAPRDILLYTGTRYFEFVLKFFYGVLIAKALGPELFGIWGFLMLMQQYLLYTGLGFQHVITVELSNKSSQNRFEQEQIISNALGATLSVSIFITVMGALLQFGQFGLLAKYQVEQYAVLMAAMVGMMHLVNLLLCAYRVHGDVLKISIVQLLRVAIPMSTLFIFQGERLVSMILVAMLLANLAGMGIFVHQAPFRMRFTFEPAMIRRLIGLGLPLLVYNVAFNLIMISGRTVLSIFYPVAVMGLYSFASSITNAMMIGFKSIVFVLMPDIIYETRQDVDDAQAAAMVNKVNRLYSTGVFAAAWGVVLVQPLIFALLPDFRTAGMSVSLLMLAQAVLSATFGYNTLALSRGHQMAVARISLQSVLFVTVTSLVVALMSLPYEGIAVTVLGGAYLFALLQTRLGSSLLGISLRPQDHIFNALSLANTVAILLFLAGSLFGYGQGSGYVAAAIFVIGNRSILVELLSVAVPAGAKQ